MRRILLSIFIIVLLICSMSLISCEAIKAQNINIDSFSGMKGGAEMGPRIQKDLSAANEDPGMSGGPDLNANKEMHGIINADLMGKIISVDGNIITIELIEQTENKKFQNSSNKKQDMKDSDNSDSLNAFSSNRFEINYTGTYKTLEVTDDVDISPETNIDMQTQNSDTRSQAKISDLKKDQIIMVWYKENSDTVGQISVLNS